MKKLKIKAYKFDELSEFFAKNQATKETVDFCVNNLHVELISFCNSFLQDMGLVNVVCTDVRFIKTTQDIKARITGHMSIKDMIKWRESICEISYEKSDSFVLTNCITKKLSGSKIKFDNETITTSNTTCDELYEIFIKYSEDIVCSVNRNTKRALHDHIFSERVLKNFIEYLDSHNIFFMKNGIMLNND